MLTGLAILERELGRIEYERHGLRHRLAGKAGRAEAARWRRELADLDRLRRQTLELLDQWNQDYADRVGHHAA